MLSEQGVTIRARHRQRLALEAGPDEALYLVRRGVFFVGGGMPGARSQILSLLYPGDLISPRALPAMRQAGLIATSSGAEVLRLRCEAAKALADADSGIALFITDRMTELAARMALRGVMIAGLTGEQRVAALFMELAQRIGKRVGSGLMFEMPMTRIEISEYLALNADTVSRTVSRLRAKGTITRMGGRRFLFREDADLGGKGPSLQPRL
jgi:CRP/FNR family transcriptional regulator